MPASLLVSTRPSPSSSKSCATMHPTAQRPTTSETRFLSGLLHVPSGDAKSFKESSSALFVSPVNFPLPTTRLPLYRHLEIADPAHRTLSTSPECGTITARTPEYHHRPLLTAAGGPASLSTGGILLGKEEDDKLVQQKANERARGFGAC
ncbi:hypothetical protein HPB47_015796 [Ixodes persulcatus]|uniref:Uncharacterized protein n=1 Tax=Ixodes persulcatus TaxID=34615 RepID=A0AC60QTR6_IXOPE|nr:hypothetical protein HPB47_015796 [Ixodes persulcatus]